MRRRFRKKKHCGEFLELGFEVKFRFVPGLPDAERNETLDRFVTEAIEGNGLVIGGGGTVEMEFFVTLDKRGGSVTERQRQRVEDWLAKCPRITAPEVGPLRDAWHDRTG
jgi:uncharacterized protein